MHAVTGTSSDVTYNLLRQVIQGILEALMVKRDGSLYMCSRWHRTGLAKYTTGVNKLEGELCLCVWVKRLKTYRALDDSREIPQGLWISKARHQWCTCIVK
jgi:hypothetical protein